MPFVSAGEASEAGRNAQAHMQSLMEMLFKLAERSAAAKGETSPEPELDPAAVADVTPSLADSLSGQLDRDSIHGALVQLSGDQPDGLVYQAEGFSVFRETQPLGTRYQVASPEGEPLLTFDQVGDNLQLIDDSLPPELKQVLLGAADKLKPGDLEAILHNPDPKAVVESLGDAAPVGTRAAWVTQQMLAQRDSITPDQSNFKFDRDRATGNLTVTDQVSQQVLLQMTPQGHVQSSMSVEQNQQFKPAFERLQSFTEAQKQQRSAGQSASKTAGKSTTDFKSKAVAGVQLER